MTKPILLPPKKLRSVRRVASYASTTAFLSLSLSTLAPTLPHLSILLCMWTPPFTPRRCQRDSYCVCVRVDLVDLVRRATGYATISNGMSSSVFAFAPPSLVAANVISFSYLIRITSARCCRQQINRRFWGGGGIGRCLSYRARTMRLNHMKCTMYDSITKIEKLNIAYICMCDSFVRSERGLRARACVCSTIFTIHS